MSLKIRYICHDCYEMVLSSGKVLVMNPGTQLEPKSPVNVDQFTGADYVAITEDSYVTVADLPALVKKFNSKVICSPHLGRILHGRPFVSGFFNLDYANVVEATPGQTLRLDGLTVEVKQAEHISLLQSFRIKYRIETGKDAGPEMTIQDLRKVVPAIINLSPEAKKTVEKLEEAGIMHHDSVLNYLFQSTDNLRIYYYFGGTYDFMRRELEAAHPNILIIQLYGNIPEKVAEFAAESGAEVVIPLGVDWPKGDNRMLKVMAQHLKQPGLSA
ncbi:MAG: hypothetical protein HYX83_02675 [Chloroflexi bacterium]|nr:hypothetical protein [Chloroflexota bacterium]